MTTHTPPPPKLLFFLLVLLSPLLMQAQTLVNQLWKERTGHPTKAFDFMSAARGKSVAGSKGTADNVYVVGNTYHLGQEENAVVYKYTLTGSLVWTFEYNSVSDYRDFGMDIYCKNGLVYVTGVSWDSINNYSEIVVLALDETNGTEAWRYVYQPAYGGYAVPAGIQVDGNQLVYVAGTEQTDSAEFGLVSIGISDGGNEEWVSVYDSIGMYDGGVALKVYESNGDTLVKVTGYSGTAFGSWDFVSLNMDNKGNVLSTARHSNGNGNLSYPVDLTTDYSGNLYVLGTIGLSATNRDWKLIKYDTLFNEVWVRTYGSADSLFDEPRGMVADYGGQLLLTGYTSTTDGSNLATTVRYNTNGNITWQTHIAAPTNGQNAKAYDLVLPNTPNTNFYICGVSSHQGDDDFFTAKYDINGNLKWLKYFNDTTASQDEAHDVQVMQDGYILTSGLSVQDSVTRYVSVAYKEADFYIPTETDSPSTAYAFYENLGQILINDSTAADSVFYYTNAGNPQLYIGDRRLSYVMASADSAGLTDTVYRIDFTVGSAAANSRENIFPDRKTESFLNYFLGQLPGPVTKVQGHNRLVQNDVLRDVDWHIYSTTAGIKNYIVVSPKTSTANLEIKYTGADSISISNKRLTLHTAIGKLTLDSLIAFTVNSSGVRTSVTVNYDSVAPGKFKFTFGSYVDSNYLVVSWKMGPNDVQHISQPELSTYLGGAGHDEGTDIAFDIDGNVYVSGFTNSIDFPIAQGQGSTFGSFGISAGDFDAFVSKFGSALGASQGIIQDGDKLLWRTYWGGTGEDKALSIVSKGTNATGTLSFTGYTKSGNFPTYPTGGYYQSSKSGSTDAFIVSIDNNRGGMDVQLRKSTYYGGYGDEVGYSIALNNSDEVSIGGSTTTPVYSTIDCSPSISNLFPACTTFSAYNNSGYGGGVSDGFVAKFNGANQLVWSTFYGGSLEDIIYDIAYNRSNTLYLTGKTKTGASGFPITASSNSGAYNQSTAGRGFDAFISKFTSNGSHQWCSYFGGGGDDEALCLTFDNSSNVFIAGSTSSDTPACSTCLCTPPAGGIEFPLCKQNVTPTPFFQGSGNTGVYGGGDQDGFLAGFSTTDNFIWGTYYGGNYHDIIYDIAVDAYDNLFFTGRTGSNSPLTNLHQIGPNQWDFDDQNLGGFEDVFLGYFNLNHERRWSTYYSYPGASNDDYGSSIEVYNPNASNHFWYITGATNSDNFKVYASIATGSPSYCCPNSYIQWTLGNVGSSTDAFLVRFSMNEHFMTALGNVSPNPYDILIYPNPTSYSISVKLSLAESQAVSFNIYSIDGKVTHHIPTRNETGEVYQTFDFSSLPPGIYLVRVNVDGQFVTGKVIKHD